MATDKPPACRFYDLRQREKAKGLLSRIRLFSLILYAASLMLFSLEGGLTFRAAAISFIGPAMLYCLFACLAYFFSLPVLQITSTHLQLRIRQIGWDRILCYDLKTRVFLSVPWTTLRLHARCPKGKVLASIYIDHLGDPEGLIEQLHRRLRCCGVECDIY